MAKRIRNLFGTLLLITAIIVTQIPVTDVEAEGTASASDFQMDGTTLVKYTGTAEDVSISNYVEKIEAEAFAGNTSVKHVTIGIDVESIGSRAFAECTNLQSVSIPDSVETIEEAAFSGCPVLNKVTIGTGLKNLGNGAFAGDYSLANVDISSSNPRFTCEDGAIYHKKDLDTLYQVLAGRKGEAYKMPSTVKQIRPYAFWGDKRLQSVKISDNVQEVPGHCFSNCKNLKDVDIPYSVKTIDMKAFEDCVRIRNISIPPSVTAIHSTAFDGCTMLNIDAEPGTYAKQYAEGLVLEEIDVSEYEEIPGTVFDTVSGNDLKEKEPIDVDYYHEVTHMDPMEEVGDAGVAGVTRIIGGQAFVLVDNATATVNVGSTGEKLGGKPETPEVYRETVPGLSEFDVKGGLFPKYTIVKDKTVAAQAYYNHESDSANIPSGVEKIGDFAYARSTITNASIPDGTKTIGYAAFYHCDSLKDVNIPLSVNHIEPAAFQKTPWLTEWQRGMGGDGDFLIVGDNILLAYRGNDKQVVIPDGVKQIAADAFRENELIEEITIPESVNSIGEAAFEDCSSLKKVSGLDGVIEIHDRAFCGCPLQASVIPESVKHIGLRAFDSTGSDKADEDKIVVFESETFPELSYDESATKLYRDAYRDLAFKGCEVAVVPGKFPKTKGTVLDVDQLGFEGTICYIGKEASENETGTLLPLSRHGGNSVNGKKYLIDGLTYVVEGAAISELGSKKQDSGHGNVEMKVSSSSIDSDAGVSAVLDGAVKDYLLECKDSTSAKNNISNAYKELFGNKVPKSLKGYELTLTEINSDIPITGLGKQEMQVTIPIPSGVGKDNIHVVCLDYDGQLEEVSSSIINEDGRDKVCFRAKHFSEYGIYNYIVETGNTARVQGGQAVFTSLSKKDDSPDTGDYSIHPKWFLASGLFFMGLACFFIKGK